jgi:MSHA biogenesis protein MshE
LSELNHEDTKIITVEDPIEYQLPRITQVQVEPKIDLTFARVLRSTLRQDPDIIMVGELRDHETAEIAIRAAMTGHFVLSTLHTNDAITSAVRLLDMGIEGYLIASVLRAVISQRLVRRICLNCCVDHAISPQEEAWLISITGKVKPDVIFKQGEGCAYCHQTGYKGRIALFELLEINKPLADALRLNKTLDFVQLVKNEKDFKSLVFSGLDLAVSGITTLSEVISISGDVQFDSHIEKVVSG